MKQSLIVQIHILLHSKVLVTSGSLKMPTKKRRRRRNKTIAVESLTTCTFQYFKTRMTRLRMYFSMLNFLCFLSIFFYLFIFLSLSLNLLHKCTRSLNTMPHTIHRNVVTSLRHFFKKKTSDLLVV